MTQTELDLVHLSDYAEQPSVRIYCTQQWGTPAWKGTPADRHNLPDGVHSLDIDDGPAVGVLYTFDVSKVTCPKCKERP
jgi:hypothetical protein